MERYKFAITEQGLTLTLSAAFAAKMNDPKSEEYALVRKFQHDFPNIVIVRKTHATPKRYKNRDGSVTERNKNNGLTYERMERFMSALGDDGLDYLELKTGDRDNGLGSAIQGFVNKIGSALSTCGIIVIYILLPKPLK